MVNARLHALGTIAIRAYSPGLITALVLYPPISIAALRHSKLTAPATIFIRAIDAGVFLHLLVLLVAFA